MSQADNKAALGQYLIVTANYWAFTLTDGALRMLVVLYFHQLGYAPLEIALLFVFYEAFGIATNLVGGWLGARIGLNRIMNIGLLLQVIALSALLVPSDYLTVFWVMAAQALSGIAKDLNKMSAKSAIKFLVPSDKSASLFKWVARLTGSKNTLKGVGFFLGGTLLATLGFRSAILVMAAALFIVWLCSIVLLKDNRASKSSAREINNKPKFRDIFSKSPAINTLSAARLFLFGARDVWFVVALPVYLSSTIGWTQTFVGGFLAAWVIFYGLVQSSTPSLYKPSVSKHSIGKIAFKWSLPLALIPTLIALSLVNQSHAETSLVIGLLIFGGFFAINSALHSFLIVHFASSDNVSLDVGFYYMANASGRLLGTILSGYVYQAHGLEACLIISSLFIATAACLSLRLDSKPSEQT